MELDERAAREVAAHLTRLDRALPDLVVGLHVVGSATLGDYRPGASDLDLCVELAREVDDDELALAGRGAGFLADTVYVPAGALDGRHPRLSDVPWAHAVPAHGSIAEVLTPVLQLQLARYSATVRGAAPLIRADPAAAREHWRSVDAGYWRGEIEELGRRLDEWDDGAPVPTFRLVWLATGVARLWHNMNTGEIISKTQAGRLAASRWPDLAEPLLDIVAVRTGAGAELTARHAHAIRTLAHRALPAS